MSIFSSVYSHCVNFFSNNAVEKAQPEYQEPIEADVAINELDASELSAINSECDTNKLQTSTRWDDIDERIQEVFEEVRKHLIGITMCYYCFYVVDKLPEGEIKKFFNLNPDEEQKLIAAFRSQHQRVSELCIQCFKEYFTAEVKVVAGIMVNESIEIMELSSTSSKLCKVGISYFMGEFIDASSDLLEEETDQIFDFIINNSSTPHVTELLNEECKLREKMDPIFSDFTLKEIKIIEDFVGKELVDCLEKGMKQAQK